MSIISLVVDEQLIRLEKRVSESAGDSRRQLIEELKQEIGTFRTKGYDVGPAEHILELYQTHPGI